MMECVNIVPCHVSSAATAIVLAGLVCGVLDCLSAIVSTRALGGGAMRMFQGIARGVQGASALQQGANSALLGVALHFAIAFGAATVCYLASRFPPVLVHRARLAAS
jgi:hypothetical protein